MPPFITRHPLLCTQLENPFWLRAALCPAHSLSTFLQAHPEMSISVQAELADHMIITAAQLGHMELLEYLLALGGNVDVCCSERCGRGVDRSVALDSARRRGCHERRRGL